MATLGDKLRMKSQSSTNVASRRGEFLIAWPSLRRRCYGEGEDPFALTPRYRFGMVGIKVEVAVEVYERAHFIRSHVGAV